MDLIPGEGIHGQLDTVEASMIRSMTHSSTLIGEVRLRTGTHGEDHFGVQATDGVTIMDIETASMMVIM